MKGVLPWLVKCWARRAGTIDFVVHLAALVSPVQEYYFPHRTLFHYFSPNRPATWQAVVLGSLSLYLSI